MKFNRYKSYGWFNESYRHSLAAKGIKTTSRFAADMFPKNPEGKIIIKDGKAIKPITGDLALAGSPSSVANTLTPGEAAQVYQEKVNALESKQKQELAKKEESERKFRENSRKELERLKRLGRSKEDQKKKNYPDTEGYVIKSRAEFQNYLESLKVGAIPTKSMTQQMLESGKITKEQEYQFKQLEKQAALEGASNIAKQGGQLTREQTFALRAYGVTSAQLAKIDEERRLATTGFRSTSAERTKEYLKAESGELGKAALGLSPKKEFATGLVEKTRKTTSEGLSDLKSAMDEDTGGITSVLDRAAAEKEKKYEADITEGPIIVRI
jgi:hypothetical protein